MTITSITSASFEKYLFSNGWEKDFAFQNKQLIVFKKQDQVIAFPASERYEDFYARVNDVIHTLAGLSRKAFEAVVEEIVNINSDRLEFRIVSDLSADGKIPLKYASKCVEGLKELILYSACAEQNAQPICLRATKSAMQHLENFKLAQTKAGSYIFNIDIKVIDENFDAIVLDYGVAGLPFEHRVVERINTALKQVDMIVNREKQISNVTENGYETGITANMCDAFLKLQPEDGEAEIFADFYYAASLNIQKNVGPIKMEGMHFHVINDIAKIYRDKKVLNDVILEGKVIILRRGEDNIIHLSAEFDGRNRNVEIPLDATDYCLACDAHRDDKEVRVTGLLDMSERTWLMLEVTGFNVID